MLLGWEVKWKNSFRDFTGVVVEQVGDSCVVFEAHEDENFQLTTKQIKQTKPALQLFSSYRRGKLIEVYGDKEGILKVHDVVVDEITALKGDRSFEKAKQDAINSEITLKAAAQRVHISTESDIKFASKFSALKTDSKGSKDEGSDVLSPGKESVVESSSDESSDSSDEEEAADGEDSDEESEDSSSDDSSDSSDDSTSSSDDSDAEEDNKVDIKVHVLPSNDIRGFSVRLTDSGLESIQKALRKDYGAVTNLFFRDSDGDAVSIKSASDLKYASRSSKSQSSAAGASNTSFKLKLFAETESSAAPAAVTKTESSSLLQGTTETTVRFAPVSQVNFIGQAGGSQADTLMGSRGPGTPTFSLPLEAILSRDVVSSQDLLPSPARSALNYEVVWKKGELLGSGSFGKVYSGMNLSSGERIAVKEVVLRRGKKHRQQAQALQLEVKILSSLDHPNIIKYLGTEYTRQTLRIFLELANDGTIKDALNEFGAFPEPLVRRYTADILEGLWFLHSKKFIHRDIKPTNLLVSGGRVKLGDFGCSTSIVEDDSATDAFHNTVAGTAVYMAPEVMQVGIDVDLVAAASQNGKLPLSPRGQPSQAGMHANQAQAADTQSRTIQRVVPPPAPVLAVGAGLKRVDSRGAQESRSVLAKRPKGYGKRADIWSVGITLIEMSTGRAPFANAGAAIYAVCVSKQYPSFPDQFSSEAHAFLSRCLVDDPKIRATSAELRLLPFMNAQSADVMRAQTAAMPRTAHTLSNVTVHLPEDFSFLQSPRGGGDDMERESREGRACREESKMTSFTGDDWFRTAVTSNRTSHIGGAGAMKAGSARNKAGEFTDTDAGSIAQRKLWSRTQGMDPLGVESKAQTEFNDSDSENSSREDPLRSTSSRMFYTAGAADRAPYMTARSVSQDDDMFQQAVEVSRAARTSPKADASALSKEMKRRSRGRDEKAAEFHSAKECSEDEDCKTGYSTLFS